MPYRFSMQVNGDHLRFEVSGKRVPGELVPEMLKLWALVADECRAHGVTRVLGVNGLRGPASHVDVFDISKQLPALLGGAVHRIAFVILGGAQAMKVSQFAEDVAVNRGLNGRVFADEQSALAWLRSP
jgi:hypothetical protein